MRFVWWFVLVGSVALVVAGFVSGRSIASVTPSVRANAVAMPASEDRAVVPFERVAHGTHSFVAVEADDREAVAAAARPNDAPHEQRERGRLALIVIVSGDDAALDSALLAVSARLTFAVAPDATAEDLHAIRDAGGSILLDVARGDAASAAASLRRVEADGLFVRAGASATPPVTLVRALAQRKGVLVDAMPDGELGWYVAARAQKLRRLTRDLVLDARDDATYEAYLMREAVRLAHRSGRAVAVAHASGQFARMLAELPELAQRANVDIVPVTELAYI